ncbi:MAG: PstS family phosphate ABC transporter substrate-binding protein [Methanosarcina flavescens]|jgi:phosphate transport system substrate-binding protein|uniref:PstS family phosphate ABC transporter substrate-binding protein n=1 Tax=Methanosarcina flavescens TaxID=1715806 RepID=A0A660HT11_9EURY|nr:PstS family phosphate ABC transporter substrate-binding protein [Methanosarcina flavescens]AYK15481.1 PstS family phosphate ABC transporter substrate-binding protein [Methanosarcina flavescens]NLK31866.1 PstS family phosphate ABC transporter substrate-binding protein [Methanosarcina flavescens]
MVNRLKSYIIFTLFVLGFVFLGAGCIGNESSKDSAKETSSGRAGSQEISLKGSDTVLPLAQAEAEEFMNENPGKSVTVTGGGSGVGITALIDGEVDIATASREMRNEEVEYARVNGINPVEHAIAYDGISVIVNPQNPVSELTFGQLRGIYNGSVTNWKEVGGEDRPIVAISRDSSSGTYEYFKEEVLLGDEFRPDALTQPATGVIIGEVSQNPNAVGYIGVAYLDKSVKGLNLDGGNGSVPPTPENIISGAYPLSRPLYFYTNGEPSGLTKEFIDFVMSEKGQNLISEVGYFPINR